MLLYLLFIPLVAWGQTRIYLNNGDQTLSSGTYIISNYTGKNRIIITENATVTITLENVNITTTTEQGDVSPFDASKASSVTLLLKGSNSLTAVQQAPGLHAPEGEGRSITIKDGGAGSLTAQGAESWPGIGVLFNTASNITIESGTITARGGGYGAGIGSSWGGDYKGTIKITGGNVTATGGLSAAGIGGGRSGSGGTIIISGGIVTATGGSNAAGIGIGNEGSSSSFSTGENGNAVIFASSITDQTTKDGWSGVIFEGTTGQVYKNQTLSDDITIPEGTTLTIPENITLTIPNGVTLTNNGTIINNGTITGDGVIRGNIPDGWTGKAACMLIYDLNGGTGTAPAAGYQIAGDEVTLPETTSYTKEGYTCLGWATTADATEALTSYTMPKKAVTLYAVWKLNTFTLEQVEIPTLTYGTEMESVDLSAGLSNNAEADCGEITFSIKEGSTLPTGLTLSGDSILSGTPTAANEEGTKVTITATAENGSTAEQTVKITIEKATPTFADNWGVTGKTYDGKAIEITAPTLNGVNGETISEDITLQYKGQGDETYTAEAPTDAGTYYVKASFAGNNNYNSAEKTTQFTIAQATPKSPTAPKVEDAVTYGTKLNAITLPTGWTWADGETVPTVENSSYTAYYTVTDYTNYDWSKVDGWNGETHQVERTVTVTVTPAKATLSFAEAELTVEVGKTTTNTLTTKPEGLAVIYSVDDTEVATIAEDGTITALAVGETTVKVESADKNYSGSATYTLKVEAGKIEISRPDDQEQAITLEAGGTAFTLIATITGLPKSEQDGKWTWTSNATDVATVDKLTPEEIETISTRAGEETTTIRSEALVMPVSEGDAIITVTYKSNTAAR